VLLVVPAPVSLPGRRSAGVLLLTNSGGARSVTVAPGEHLL